MRPISSNVIRGYRKRFLDSDGIPLPGCERQAQLLLDVMRLLQAGQVFFARELAWDNGLDLSQPFRIR